MFCEANIHRILHTQTEMRELPAEAGQHFQSFFNGCDSIIVKPWQENWSEISKLSFEQLIAYFLITMDMSNEWPDNYLKDEHLQVLYSRWDKITRNARGRSFIRTLVVNLFAKYDRLDSPAYCLSDEAKLSMRKYCPDVYQKVMSAFIPMTINLPVLLEIEKLYIKTQCRKSKSPETLIESSLAEALQINFFRYASIMGLRWWDSFERLKMDIEWAIPPMKQLGSKWSVNIDQFQQRLSWMAPFLPEFMRDERVRWLGVVLTGSLIPLCVLEHQINTADRGRFIEYARETYRKCSIDLFITDTNFSPGQIESIVLEALDKYSDEQTTWKIDSRKQWSEDDDSWVRNRHGYTIYFRADGQDLDIHLVVMAESSLRDAISQQHLDCVRAYWNGSSLLATASCCISWMTRLIFEMPLFGNHIEFKRRSKIMVKYAIRGFGFTTTAIQGLQIPSTIHKWLSEDFERGRRPLPWFHPLYNPNLWKKDMTPDREIALLECAAE